MESLELYTNEQIFKEARMRQEQIGGSEKEEQTDMEKMKDMNNKEFPCTCSKCGEKTTVPFKPRENWPVYCRDCYAKRGR